MPLVFRRSKKIGKGLRLNISRTGASVSKKIGPFSLSSRGVASVRLARGLSFRTRLW